MSKFKLFGAFLGVFILIGVSQASAISTDPVQSNDSTTIAELQAKIKMLTAQIQELQTKLKSIQNVSPSDLSKPKEAMGGEIRKNVCYGLRADADVKAVQSKLKEEGYFKDEVTGNYLTKTDEAVRMFQKERGLPPVECVGPKTREAMMKKKEMYQNMPAKVKEPLPTKNKNTP